MKKHPMDQMHPMDLEARALAAHRRRVRTGNTLSASVEEIGAQCFVAVREHGAAIEAYQVQRNQLRRAKRVPEPIW
jgi:hypothetical protein